MDLAQWYPHRLAARVTRYDEPRPVWRRRAALGLVLLSVCTIGAVSYSSLKGGVGRWVGAGRGDEMLVYSAIIRDLEINVLASGILESASTQEVLSEVEGQVGIIRLMKRGKRVAKGDVVVELDSSLLRTTHLQQQVTVQQAKAATAQAKESLQIANSQAESDVNAAELVLRFAELDHRKYLEGDYPQELRVAQSDITLADEELKRARERIKYSQELKKLGYLSEGQVEADKLVVLRGEETLNLAREKRRLLEDFTHQRMLQEIESKVAEAKRSLIRTRALAQAAVSQAETKLKTQQSTEALEESKLTHLANQFEKCSLRAPQDGVVLYPIPEGEDGATIREGAMVRQHQHVFTIPNTDKLQVNASVHEALLHLVKPGKIARVFVDSFPDRELLGTTTEISSVPDLQSWRKSTVNFYPAKVLIENDDVADLRPGMNAKVEILIETLESVLPIPVQAVVRAEKRTYCIVMRAGKPLARRIRLGQSNDQFVVVKDGLIEGDQIVLSPDEVQVVFPKEE